MRRPTPPLQTREAALRQWQAVGTPSDVCRRLKGSHGRADVHAVRDWAALHGYLVQRPPHGLQLSTAGARWLAEIDAGLDPDERRRTVYTPPDEPARRGKPRRRSGAAASPTACCATSIGTAPNAPASSPACSACRLVASAMPAARYSSASS
jgi:hypothetical protein